MKASLFLHINAEDSENDCS